MRPVISSCCKSGWWKREVVDWARRIRGEKLRGHQYREGYTRFLEGKRVEWDGENNVEHIIIIIIWVSEWM